jgi:hypothetical protein
VPPTDRQVPRFAAEPPQEPLPYGRWSETLAAHFGSACSEIDEQPDPEVELTWFPDRSYGGRTYVPVTVPAAGGGELFGYVSYRREGDESQAADFQASASWTDDTAEDNPDWTLDLSDDEIASWRGPQGRRGTITLVWGVGLVPNGAVATAELGPTTTDQCELADSRFTLVSLDQYTGDYIEVRLYDRRGGELATESLYEED